LQLGGLFSEEAQAEAFGADGDFRCPSQAMPLGTAVRVDGGWLINGTWPYCSGAPYGTHFMPAALAPGEGSAPEIVYAIIPRAQWTMLDDWGDNILGLCGSGSHSIVVKDAIVPDHAVVRVNPLDVDVPQPAVGYRIHGNPMYAGGRTLAFFHGELVSVMIGAARAALDEFERIIRLKNTYLPPIMPRYKHPEFQRAVGLALGMIDAAEAIVLHGAERFMENCRRSAEDGESFSAEKDWRLFASHEHAGRLAWEAMEVLWRNAGSSDSSVHGQRMQRYYRDVSMYRGHFSARFERMARPLGALYLGEPFFELIS
jgi:3-hydroxy-9,10-secoandrosta-1,3,5(10)-triene-9,17-dione monooxygenase